MGVTMGDCVLGHQGISCLQCGNDLFVNFIDMGTGELPRCGGEHTIFIDQVESSQAIQITDIEIVDTVIGCGMYRAGTGFDGDVLPKD